MNKKNLVGILVIGLGLVISLSYYLTPKGIDSKISSERIVIEDYPKIAREIKQKIDDLSPTPPTEKDWHVEAIEFVSNENLVYVTYHDTHNVFRMLLKIVKQQHQYDYILQGTFEKTNNGWQRKFGDDLGANKSLIKIE